MKPLLFQCILGEELAHGEEVQVPNNDCGQSETQGVCINIAHISTMTASRFFQIFVCLGTDHLLQDRPNIKSIVFRLGAGQGKDFHLQDAHERRKHQIFMFWSYFASKCPARWLLCHILCSSLPKEQTSTLL